MCACSSVAAIQGEIVSGLSAPHANNEAIPRLAHCEPGATADWQVRLGRAPRRQSTLQPAARARRLRQTKTPAGILYTYAGGSHVESNEGETFCSSRSFNAHVTSNGEVEGPARGAPARRGRTIPQRPRRQTDHASRTPPTIVRQHAASQRANASWPK